MIEIDEFSVETVKKVPKSQRFRHNYNSVFHRVNGEYPTTWARRTLKKYVNKPYDEAFSYFCTLVSPYQQDWFRRELMLSDGYWVQGNKYTVDKEGIIRAREKKQNNAKVKFISHDYKIGYKDKITGRVKEFDTYWHYEARRMRENPDMYEEIVVSGYVKEFESKHDREYVRLMKEKAKITKLAAKLEKRKKKKIAYSFMTKEERIKKSDIEKDLIKVKKHGFDEESFRGIEYHGQKRKLK